MRKAIVFIAMIITPCLAQSQLAGIYTYDYPEIFQYQDNLPRCNIYLFKDGKYYMELSEQATSDIIRSCLLSYGNYIKKGSLIVFTDRLHNFRMEMTLDNDALNVKHAFSFVTGGMFSFNCRNDEASPDLWDDDLSPDIVKKKREDYIQHNSTPFYFGPGTYEDEQACYRLEIEQSDNEYFLYYKDLLISEGSWNKNENELVLSDTILKHSFYLLIGDKSLTSSLIPGDTRNIVLRKK